MTETPPSEKFDALVQIIGEQLKALGFKRRGLIFRITGPDTAGIIQFQRSLGNTKAQVKFTVNLGVVCGALLTKWEPPLAKATVWDAQVRLRIRKLLPEQNDKWWEITAATDIEQLTVEIQHLVLEKGVPFLQPLSSTDAIIGLWESGHSPGITDGRRVELLAALKTTRAKQAD